MGHPIHRGSRLDKEKTATKVKEPPLIWVVDRPRDKADSPDAGGESKWWLRGLMWGLGTRAVKVEFNLVSYFSDFNKYENVRFLLFSYCKMINDKF